MSAHKEKMEMKAARRAFYYEQIRAMGLPPGFTPAWMNRHTRLPHEHKREIARRCARTSAAT